MIQDLYIKNFAIAEDVHLKFGQGLNILTGETGAGKSIIINALMAILGERTSSDVIRSGTESAVITGVVKLPDNSDIPEILSNLDIEVEEDELILRRVISANGKSKAYINDIPVNLKVLKEIGDRLVDIHGQHEHQYLLNEKHHLPYLDKFLPDKHLLTQVQDAFNRVKVSEQKLNDLQALQSELLQKKDYLEFQLKELKEAELREGELAELESESRKLADAEKINLSCQKIIFLTEEGEPNIPQLLQELSHEVATLTAYQPELESYFNELENLKIVLNELNRDIQEFAASMDYSPGYQEEIEARIAKIRRLIKKYNMSESELIQFKEELENQLNRLENYDFELEHARSEFEEARQNYLELAKKLSAIRKTVANKLSEWITKELHQLGMPNAVFEVNVEQVAGEGNEYTPRGMDQVRFMFSGNPGEEVKSLSKIASGGEISRVMLALKKVFADKDDIPVLVFDEIDSGVSGETALAVGKKIYELSKTHQLICITHLPQIAAQPGNHFKVVKEIKDGHTFSIIIPLTEDDRIHEIARLIGGTTKEKSVLDSARYLLNQQMEEQ